MATSSTSLFTKSQFEAIKAVPVLNEADGTLDTEWFINSHQSEDDADGFRITLRNLQQAIKNSESFMQQFPVDSLKVKKIAVSLFVKGEQLHNLIVLNELTQDDGKFTAGSFFIEGGRNRTAAITGFLSEYGSDRGLDFGDTEVLVSLRPASSLATISERIIASNDQRTMRGVEQGHMRSQVKLHLSPDKAGKTEFSTVLSREDITKPEKLAFLGTLYYRLNKSPKSNPDGYKAETLNVLGKNLSTLLLGTEDFPQTAEAFIKAFTRFQAAIPAIVTELGITTIARSAKDIVIEYAEQLMEDLDNGVYASAPKAKKSKKSEEAAALFESEEAV